MTQALSKAADILDGGVGGRHHVKADEFKTVGDFAEYDCDAWRHLDEGRGRCELKRVGPDLTILCGLPANGVIITGLVARVVHVALLLAVSRPIVSTLIVLNSDAVRVSGARERMCSDPPEDPQPIQTP